jgi:4-hydroxybenzoate polyprenyltransferase
VDESADRRAEPARPEPLAPGERPWPIVAGALVAFALGALTLALFLADVKVAGSRPAAAPVFVYTGLMFGLGTGVWRRRYWAVLALQALLAIGLLAFALAAIRATSVAWLAICVVLIGAGGFLFFRLVGVIGRIPPSDHTGG